MLTHLRARSRSLFSSSRTQSVKEAADYLDFNNSFVKPWNSMQVYYLPYRLAARYPKTRIGQLATYTDQSRKLDLCDDYIVQSNEFFFDRDPNIFHNVFNFYRTGVLYIKDELCPHNFLEEIKTANAAAVSPSKRGKTS